jgi:CheY-like chemotaxis protein
MMPVFSFRMVRVLQHHTLSQLITSVQNTPESKAKTVLIVDDDDDTRILTKMFLNNFGYEVESANSTSEALARFDPSLHDVVLTDNSMEGMTGGEMAHIIKMRSPGTPIVMCTGSPPSDCSPIDVVIKKPTFLLAIKDAIDKLVVARTPLPGPKPGSDEESTS